MNKYPPPPTEEGGSILGKGWGNTQGPSSDIITSLLEYSSVSEVCKMFVYVNGGASAK